MTRGLAIAEEPCVSVVVRLEVKLMNYLQIDKRLYYITVFFVLVNADLEIEIRDHSRLLKVVPFDGQWLYLAPNFRHLISKNTVTLKSRSGTLEVIKTGTIQ